MKTKLYRTQLLLEPEQYTTLVKLARQRGVSISHVVREIMTDYIVHQQSTQEVPDRWAEEVMQIQAEILAERGGRPIEDNIEDLIDQMREERTEDILRAIHDQNSH